MIEHTLSNLEIWMEIYYDLNQSIISCLKDRITNNITRYSLISCYTYVSEHLA